MEVIRTVPLRRIIAERAVVIEIRQLARDFIVSSRGLVTRLAAGHRIDLVQRPLTDTALEDHDVAVIDISNNVIIRGTGVIELIYAADMLGGILIAPVEIDVLVKIIIVVTDAGHAVQVVYIIADKYFLYTDIVAAAELNKLVR